MRRSDLERLARLVADHLADELRDRLPAWRTGVSGPYRHGRKWRVVVQTGGARTVRSYETEADAREFIDEWRALLDGKTVAMRLDEGSRRLPNVPVLRDR